MKGNDLGSLTVRELKARARKRGLKGYSKLKKAQLVALLGKEPESGTAGGRKTSRKPRPVAPPAIPVASPPAELKPATAPVPEPREQGALDGQHKPEVAPRPFDEHDELPGSYFKPRAVLMLKNPEWLFLHWDFDGDTGHTLAAGGGVPHLRILQNSFEVMRTQVDVHGRKYYVRVPQGGGFVRAELGLVSGGQFFPIISSNEAVAPVAEVSPDTEVAFGAPEWTAAQPEKTDSSPVLTDEQFRSFFGDLRTDLPWYRPKTRGRRRK